MTKEMNYSKVTPELITKVKDVIANGAKHTYSVSKVYAAYNAAYGLNETPQTCSSCLRNRVRLLIDWLRGYDEYAGKSEEAKRIAEEAEAKRLADEAEAKRLTDEAEAKRLADEAEAKRIAGEDPNHPQYDAPAPGVVRIPMKEGAPIDLTPDHEDDQTKGKVSYVGGAKVAPGKYTTARGETIVVQVGGKGRIEVEDLT